MNWGKVAVGVRCGSGAHPLFLQSWTEFLMKGMREGDEPLQSTAGLPHHYAAEALGKQFLYHTECDSILFIDDDIRFDSDALERLRLRLDGHSFGILQAFMVSSHPPHRPQVGPNPPPNDEVCETEHCSLAFTLIKREVFDAVRKRNQEHEMHFSWGLDGMGEDVHFSRKAKDAGVKCAIYTGVRVGHCFTMVAEWDFQKKEPVFKSWDYCGAAKVREVGF